MKSLQLIFLPLLIIAVSWGFYAAPWQVKDESAKLERELGVRPKVLSDRTPTDELDDFLDENKPLSEADADKQWRRSLFNPDRKEMTVEEVSIEKEKGALDDGEYEFELIGAGKYGNKEFASITVKPKKGSRSSYSRTTAFRTSTSRSKSPRTLSSKSSTPEKRREGQSNVVKKGEEVGETGYKLTKIHFVPRRKQIDVDDTTYVVITKGSKSLELHLDKGGKSSEVRIRELNKKEPVAKPEKVEEKEKDEKTLTPPQPPPPPPPPPGVSLPTPSKNKKGDNGEQKSTLSDLNKRMEELRKKRNELKKRK